MLERKSDKLKSKDRKMCVYVGYPKEIVEDYFGNHKEDIETLFLYKRSPRSYYSLNRIHRLGL